MITDLIFLIYRIEAVISLHLERRWIAAGRSESTLQYSLRDQSSIDRLTWRLTSFSHPGISWYSLSTPVLKDPSANPREDR